MFTEEELIDRCVKGDRKAQYQLYESFSPRMYVVCLRYCKAQQEAEDVLQDSFVKVFKYLKSFRKDASLYYWIKRIVVNTALNHLRNKLYLFPMVDIEETHQTNEPCRTLAEYAVQDILEILDTLPEGCRVIFNLYAIEGYKHHEIAELLGISMGTSKSQYFRAKKLLQEKFKALDKVSYGKIQS
jgi:RNA polymerase sigma-70 factor (ECF subfamily)